MQQFRANGRAVHHVLTGLSLCLAGLMGGRAAQAQMSLGTKVDATQRAGNDAEGAIAVDPTNSQRVFMFSNSDSSGNALVRGVSSDGGATWTRSLIATGADGLTAACCDPSCAWDNFGNLFICYLTSATHTVVAWSTNGGASFSAPVDLSGASSDQPTIAVGNGSVWVCYNTGGTMRARGAAVTGLGVVGAFSAVQSGGSGSFGDIAVGPAGQVLIVYGTASGQGPASIFGNLDADGLGAGGFAATTTITSTNVGGFDFIPAQSGRSIDAESGLAWDRTGGPHNGRVYLVYTEETVNENNDTEIYLRYSDNNGTTWTAPVRVNDDTVGNLRSQFLPKIAIDQTTGIISVVWYDCRNDNGVMGTGSTNTVVNDDAEFYGTVSTNYGVSFLPNINISPGVCNDNAAASGIDYGDYIGLAYQNRKFLPVWADNSGTIPGNRNGTLHQFDQIVVPVTVTYCSADINASHTVDVNDLLAVISAWGPCPAGCGTTTPRCTADIAPVGPPEGDCAVDVNDLLLVISTWGPCP